LDTSQKLNKIIKVSGKFLVLSIVQILNS